MTSILILIKDWRYRDRKRGMQTMVAGQYLIPSDVTRDRAEQAEAQGMGRIEPALTSEAGANHSATVGRAIRRTSGARRNSRRKAKGPAPENRMLDGPPDDKQTLV